MPDRKPQGLIRYALPNLWQPLIGVPLRCLSLVFLFVVVALLGTPCTAAQDPPVADRIASQQSTSTEDLAFFEKKIRPVLVKSCFECHSSQAEELSGELNLETAAGRLQGGSSGPAIVPGKPEESPLWQALQYSGEFYDMPPSGKLPDEVLADFARWIRSGAAAPADAPSSAAPKTEQHATPQPDRRHQHWSFQPVRPAAPPAVAHADWVRDPLDLYVLARLEEQGIAPAADSAPRIWLRRVYLDLVGLPPAPDVMQAFLADPSRQARERIVDQLLASPAFGERWGRHWLDILRYADSTGGARTRLLPEAWRFRDFVIDATNRDQPYDQFIRQLLAGDLLPAESVATQRENIIASGFLALGPFNYEQQDKEQLRMDVVDEQLDTIGQAFLGLTFGCARCHDHKFDPITAADYYAMAGVFRNTQTLVDANVSEWIERPLQRMPAEQLAFDQATRDLKQADRELAEATAATQQAVRRLGWLGVAPDGARLGGVLLDDALAERQGAWVSSTSVKPFVGAGYLHDDNADKGKKSLTFSTPLPQPGTYEVRLAYTHGTNRAANAPVIVRGADGEHKLKIDERSKPPIADRFLTLGTFAFTDQAEIVISNANSNGHVIVDAVQLVRRAEHVAPAGTADAAAATDDDEKTTAEIAALLAQLASAQEKISALQARRDALAGQMPGQAKAISVKEQPNFADCAVMLGGDVHRPAEIVPRGVPAIINDFADAIPADQGGRVQFAAWVTHADNPLTSRVAVNRIWAHLFGRGIVASCDNFGVMGNEPSHPQLLDRLAADFVASGWSTKSLVRRIVLSRTYGQAYVDNPQAALIDPENQLLWRANRRRLDAEVLRDSLLVAAGNLEPSPGGPSYPTKLKDEFAALPESHVRSVYLPVFRNRLDPFFESFDFGNPGAVNGQRESSTRPTQALYLMNSPFVAEQSQALALRICQAEDTAAARLALLYELTLCRAPSASEERLLLEYVESLTAADTATANDKPESQTNSAQLAAWADVARAVLTSVDFRFVE